MKDWFLARIWHKLTGGWAPYVEDAVPAPDLTLQMHQASIPSFGFFFMLALYRYSRNRDFGLYLPTLWRVEESATRVSVICGVFSASDSAFGTFAAQTLCEAQSRSPIR